MSSQNIESLGPLGRYIGVLIANPTLLVAGIAALVFLNYVFTPRMDPNEPPLLKPKIPIIGHIIGIITEQSEYHRTIYNKHHLPAVTLQMLWGKLYSVADPGLVQSSLRDNQLSFEAIGLDFADKIFAVDKSTIDKLSKPGMVASFNKSFAPSMEARHVRAMNVNALNDLAKPLNAVKPGRENAFVADNAYLYFRDSITRATTKALFGVHDPFSLDESLITHLWKYEVSVASFGLTPIPLQRLLLPGACASRAKLQEIMSAYYTAELDSHESAAQLTRGRANACRAWGLTGREIGQCESFLPIVGATNSAPMTYWLINFVYGTPGLVSRLREEVVEIVKRETTDEEDVATVDVSRLEKECPVLVSCYRETLRKTNASVSVRRIMEDTTISDGKGHSYLLKKGVDVQLPAGVAHNLSNVWGQNVNDFYPDRFLESRTSTTTGEAGKQERRNAMIPFGGGKHLCPGRNFAIAEILGFTVTLLAGFEVETIGAIPFGKMQPQKAKLNTAMLRPLGMGEGQGVRISRREGWEKTQWRYVS